MSDDHTDPTDGTADKHGTDEQAADQHGAPGQAAGEHGADQHAGHAHEEPSGWRYWLYTTNHKVIGIIYLWHALFFFAVAGLTALVFRTELALSPGNAFLNSAGYNSLVTLHGLTMIFFVIPPLTGAFQNYFIPLWVGADEMAFPRWNALGAWSITAGGTLLWLPLFANVLGLGGLPANAGWFQYPPLTTLTNSSGIDAMILGISILLIGGSIPGGINFFTTIVNERRPDMGWFDIPIVAWAIGIFTPVLGFYAFPWVVTAVDLTFLERFAGMTFYNARTGGSPLLYQWIWWTFGHPEVYILVIPGMGIALEVISRFSERPIYGYKPVLAGFAILSTMSAGVWAHHMFTTGLGASRYAFMVFSMAIAMAFSIYIFSAIATMYKGRIHLTTPMIFAFALVIGLIYSGMEGIQLGQPAADMQLHSTYFVVGHFHFTLFMVGVLGLMSGIYYWYPLITGRMYHSLAGKYHAATTVAGLPALFFLMGRLGELGMMRRYATYTYLPELQFWHVLTTIAAYVVASGQLVFFLNMVLSLRYGERVEDPWADLLSGNDMPSPEWDGFPYEPPTPDNINDGTGRRGIRDADPDIGTPGTRADGGAADDPAAPADTLPDGAPGDATADTTEVTRDE